MTQTPTPPYCYMPVDRPFKILANEFIYYAIFLGRSRGAHCGETDVFKSNISSNANMQFQTTIQESNLAIDKKKIFYKKIKNLFLTRVINKLKGILKGKNK